MWIEVIRADPTEHRQRTTVEIYNTILITTQFLLLLTLPQINVFFFKYNIANLRNK